jgi:hypothetical protein
VENHKLKPGREYRPQITVRTDAGVLRPQLIIKKVWPWIIIEAAVIIAVIGVTVMMR